MIKVCATIISCDYSTLIKLEYCLISLDSYWNWSMWNWLFHIINILRNINKPMDLPNSLVLYKLTSSIWSCIRIIRFLFKWIFFNVFKGIVHFSTVASFIYSIFWAIYKLLFRKWVKFSCIDKHCTFDSSSGWKCPAWSTLTLIFDWSNCTFFSPI